MDIFSGNGHIIRHFYQSLVLVILEFEPIIKMLVSLREESFIGLNDNESADDMTEPNDAINDNEVTDQRVTPLMKVIEVKANKKTKPNRSPAKKKLKFDSSDDETEV